MWRLVAEREELRVRESVIEESGGGRLDRDAPDVDERIGIMNAGGGRNRAPSITR
jgi:hypothetical protein